MFLRTDDDVYMADINTVAWGAGTEPWIVVGNHEVHMTLTIHDCEAMLQDLLYDDCMPPGTVQMVKSAFTAVMRAYPDVFKIVLRDRSYAPDGRGDYIPLPEYNMLVHGQTWYQEHFGATPGDHRTAREYMKYRRARMAPISALGEEGTGTVAEYVAGIVNPTEEALDDIRRRLRHLNMLSGTLWEIPRSTVLQYGVRGEFEDADVPSAGSWKRTRAPYFAGRKRHLPAAP